MLEESGLLGEVVVFAVLEDKDAVGLQQVVAEDEAREGCEVLEGVGRVGEDEVELLMTFLQETEHVATDEDVVCRADLLHALGDEGGVVAISLHTDDGCTAAGEHLKRDAAGTGEEVEGGGVVEVDIAIEDIEDVLLGEVGGRTCLESSWYVEVPTFILSGYDSHANNAVIMSNVMPFSWVRGTLLKLAAALMTATI